MKLRFQLPVTGYQLTVLGVETVYRTLEIQIEIGIGIEGKVYGMDRSRFRFR
ncbi:MAG: hypothetical protein MUP26_08975 [Desulfobulbaceae bacterium]|nr:hypothetical protein [Desulfobulbaceae bacterium]